MTRLGREDVGRLIDWAAAEGWNPGVYDAESFYRADPKGFYGFFCDGELIAGGSLVSYAHQFGFMGLFIVKEEFRGQGIGQKLWYRRRDLLLERLRPGTAIGMDGVVHMQDFYRKGGFHLAFRDVRFALTGSTFPLTSETFGMQSSDLSLVQKMDRMCFGFPRNAFLKSWLHPLNGPTFCYRDDQGLRGFAHVRPAQNGWKIGPLFADKPQIAYELYQTCLNHAAGTQVYIDIPLSNPAALEMVQAFGAEFVFECGRMYYGIAPDLPYHNIYGLTSFELG